LASLFRKILVDTATPFAAQVKAGLYGSGILNANNLLRYPLSLPASGTGSARRYVAALTRKMVHHKDNYLTDKELMHYTLMAKLNTEDRDEELSDYVMDHCRKEVKAHIGKQYKSEQLKHRVKRHEAYWYS
jgi:hypothetical protein